MKIARKVLGLTALASIAGLALGCTVHTSTTPPPQQPAQPPPAQPVEPAPAPAPAPAPDPAPAPVPPPPPVDDLPPVYEGDLDPISGVYKNFKTRQPLVCDGNERVAIRNAIIDTRNVAVIAKGNCKVTIKKSFIRGRRIGIVARGSATVSIVGSRVVGRGGIAVRARGRSVIIARKSDFVGTRQGAFQDRGGNVFRAARIPSRPAPPPPPPPADDLPPVYEGDLPPVSGVYKNFKTRQPLVCGGNERVAIRNAVIDTRHVAVIAKGNCRVTIKKSFIRGRRIGVVARGNATVSIVGSRVVGRAGIATRARGRALIMGRRSEFVGQRQGNFKNKGGNRFSALRPYVRPRPTPPPPPPRPAPPAEEPLSPIPGVYKNFKTRQPLVCGGNERVAIRNAVIDTRNVAVIAKGNCKVTIKKSFIRGRNIGVIAQGNSTVSIVGSRIVGRSGTSVRVNGAAQVIGRQSDFVGGVRGNFQNRGGNKMIPIRRRRR